MTSMEMEAQRSGRTYCRAQVNKGGCRILIQVSLKPFGYSIMHPKESRVLYPWKLKLLLRMNYSVTTVTSWRDLLIRSYLEATGGAKKQSTAVNFNDKDKDIDFITLFS